MTILSLPWRRPIVLTIPITVVFLSTAWNSIKIHHYIGEHSIQETTQKKTKTASSVVLDHVAYELVSNNNTFRNIFNPYMRCLKAKLPPSLEPMLDFSVRISTDLKILFLGDSVSVMTAQMFQELAGAAADATSEHHYHPRTVIRYSWGTTEGTHVASVRGGGAVAGWRITGWMLPKGKTNKDFGNIGGGRWMASDVPILLQQPHRGENNTSMLDAFDAMVLRIPHGWMSLSEITREALVESLHTAYANFGFRTVIIITLPFVNNIQNEDDLQELVNINTMLREFAATYRRSTLNNKDTPVLGGGENVGGGVETVLTLDFDRLVDQIIQHNGRLLGYNETDEIETNAYLFDQCCPAAKRIMRSIPVLCAARSGPCQGNGYTLDGMHWCNEAMKGRLGGGIACLLKCAYDDDHDVAACAKMCNDRFMNLGVLEVPRVTL